MAGWSPKQPCICISELTPGMPAEKAGLKVGDEDSRLDGQPVPALAAMVESLKQTHEDKPITLTVRRAGRDEDIHAATCA